MESKNNDQTNDHQHSRGQETMNDLETHNEEHLQEFSNEELERMEAEVYGLSEEDYRRDEEFAKLEIIREAHFARMKQLENDAKKGKIKPIIAGQVGSGLRAARVGQVLVDCSKPAAGKLPGGGE